MKIAVYGKGGIGKSTVSANLSAALADAGRRVLQIGCDPKHDSTRLLLNGRVVTTVLDYMRDVPPAAQQLADLLHTGYGGVVCAEAGGPEPGVGCAGRGILSTFALFERLGLRTDAFDVVLYDVLGDVVCGGFAVPLRREYADVVCIVTSEEFMSIYAANNILRGVLHFDGGGARLAGLILNSRGRGEDPAPVHRFAGAVGLPVICHIPRSEHFRAAEADQRTVVEAYPLSDESRLFRALAETIGEPQPLHPARPLSDAALERTVFPQSPRCAPGAAAGSSLPADDGPESGPGGALFSGASFDQRPASMPAASAGRAAAGRLSKSMLFREPLHGCAFTGALSTLTQIRGAVTVAHGPRSCSHIAARTILSSGIHAHTRRGLVLPRQLAPAMLSSDMDEGVVIYGGGERLVRTLREAMAAGPEAVFVVTACPSGVIGDDPAAAVREIRSEFPDTPVLAISTDGNIRGDYMQGVINACLEGAAALIDPAITPRGRRVNILAEKNIANNAAANDAAISDLLGALGVSVNCRFVRDVDVASLRGFKGAALNLLAYDDHFGRVLRRYFQDHHGAVFAAHPFPVGFTETERWLGEIGSFFGRQAAARELAASHRGRYDAAIQRFRRHLEGKRLMIVSYIHDVDWILETAFDLGMIVEKVGILNYSQDHLFRTRFQGRFALETDYGPEKRDADLSRIRPDLMLCNYVPKQLPVAVHVDSIPLCPDVGFYGGLACARRWAALLKAPIREGWRDDGGR